MTHHNADATDIFGFWVYILSDCILFSALFATFAVLHNHVYGGPGLAALFDLNYVLVESMALLCSSFTFGLATFALYKANVQKVLCWMAVTFILGAIFVGMELHEFTDLVTEGYSWQSSAALSSFFTLVGTHGLHVSIGLLWMLVLMLQVYVMGVTPTLARRLTYFGLFWAFLDIVWIFVFTIVYLMGGI